VERFFLLKKFQIHDGKALAHDGPKNSHGEIKNLKAPFYK
jgi:hypothetical protein